MRPIETIQVGDTIYSENPITHERGLKQVAKTFIHEKDTLVYVSVNGQVIKTTETGFKVRDLTYRNINSKLTYYLYRRNSKLYTV